MSPSFSKELLLLLNRCEGGGEVDVFKLAAAAKLLPAVAADGKSSGLR